MLSCLFSGGVDFLKLKLSAGPSAAPDREARHLPDVCHTYRSHLTGWIYLLVSESQLPHKFVNLFFTTTNWNVKLLVFWGSWLSKSKTKRGTERRSRSRSTLLFRCTPRVQVCLHPYITSVYNVNSPVQISRLILDCYFYKGER